MVGTFTLTKQENCYKGAVSDKLLQKKYNERSGTPTLSVNRRELFHDICYICKAAILLYLILLSQSVTYPT